MKKYIILILFYVSSYAQNNDNIILTGSLKQDTYYALNNYDFKNENNNSVSFKRRTPILAGLMSFTIPGAGQIYNEDYLKAGIFMGIEITAIIFAIIYNNKGDDQTKFFEDYANKNWSALRYAKWTLNHLDQIAPNLTAQDYSVINSNGEVNWSELNRLEGDISGYYSHQLAPFGDQQYYEMIGKYSQFNVGWSEFGDENTPYNFYTDSIVEQFKWYSKQRRKANDYYTVAKWAVISIVTNHFINALEAAWSAARYNKRLKLGVSVENHNIGYVKNYYPQLNITFNF
ncbi:MAG: hypothetical protein CR986_04565 [Ignavibacteriae bacterium]|nr:MAG: hypothetical protein CR986_04565 [Ignavibacteriota bacterium]